MPSMRCLSNVIAEDAKASYVEKTGDTNYARKINEIFKKSVGEIIFADIQRGRSLLLH
jgi:hypothetical protein